MTNKNIENLFKWAHSLKDKKINGKSFYKYFEYNGINLWWFCIIGICQEALQYSKEVPIPKKELNLRKNIYPKVEIFIDIFQKVIGKLFYIGYKKQNKPCVFVTGDRYWKAVYNSEKECYEQIDDFFQPVMDQIKEKDIPYLSIGELQMMQNRSFNPLKMLLHRKLRKPDIPYASIESFWNFKIFAEQIKAKKNFRNVWNGIKDKKDFKNLLYGYDKVLGERLYNYFEYYFLTVLPRKIKLLEMSKNFIEQVKPRVIVLQNERAGWEQTLVCAAKEKGIKTIAIQHGVVYRLHEGYFQIKEEREDKTKADIFCIYGPETEKVLKSMHYNPKKLVVVGQPRYDKISLYENSNIRERFIKENDLHKDKKIFMIATQPLLEGLRKQYFRNVLNVLKKLNVQIVVKPHPLEEDLTFYEEEIKKQNVKAKILQNKADTFEALSSCDFFTTFSSTTALEAMLFEKPVFIFNFTDEAGTLPWVKGGAAISFKNEKTAENYLKKVINNPKILKNLLKKEKEFLEKYYYKIDGKASNRIYQLIEKFQNGNK